MNQIPGTTNQIQMITLVWIPRLTATLSCLGSLAIIYMILSARKEKLKKSNHRLMLALSIFDALNSAAYATTTLASPQDSQFYGAMGNDGTCSAQGFLAILGLAVPMYNASLNLFFLLTIRYRVRQANFSAKIEPILHATSILAPLTIATVSLSIGGIKSESATCYLSYDDSSSIVIYTLWKAISGLVYLCLFINLYSMISISRYVITRLNSVRRYSVTLTQAERIATEKREVVVQSLFYTAAFCATFFFPVLIGVFNLDGYFVLVCVEIFYPLQGFWNFLLYIRPSIGRVQRTNPDRSWIRSCCEVIFHANKRDDHLMNVRNGRDMNTIDLGTMNMVNVHELNIPSPTLSHNELRLPELNDSDETEERKSQDTGKESYKNLDNV